MTRYGITQTVTPDEAQRLLPTAGGILHCKGRLGHWRVTAIRFRPAALQWWGKAAYSGRWYRVDGERTLQWMPFARQPAPEKPATGPLAKLQAEWLAAGLCSCGCTIRNGRCTYCGKDGKNTPEKPAEPAGGGK